MKHSSEAALPSPAGRMLSRTLFKYLLLDILFSFFVAFLFFFFVFFVNQLLLMAKEILTKHVPLNQVILLVFYSLPTIVAMATPFASLMGTLMTIGRINSDNEILVMLAAGLSYRVIFLPALIVGVFISLFSFAANDVLLPAGMVQFSRLYRSILISTPALELEANSVKRFKDAMIVTGAVEGKNIDNVIILDRTSSGERRLIIAADAELTDAGREGLSLDLSGAFVQSSKEVVRGDYDYVSSGFLRYWIPTEDLIQAVSAISPKEMSSVDVRREIAAKTLRNDERLEECYGTLLSAALNLESSLRKSSGEEWNRRANNFDVFSKAYQTAGGIKRDTSLRIYRLEYYKKFSIPLGALSFVFLAVALGLTAKRSGQIVGFIFGLIISVIYWALLFAGQTMGIRLGYSPFFSMWLPNILAASIGIILLTLRIRR